MWRSYKKIISFLVDVTKFVLYLQHVGETTQSKVAAAEAVNAVFWLQHVAGHGNVFLFVVL